MAKKRVNSFIESLGRRVFVEAASNVFPDEKEAIKKFGEDYRNAKDILKKAGSDVKDSVGLMGTPKSVISKLAKQARTANFGLSQSDLTKLSDKAMGFDFGDEMDDLGDFGNEINESFSDLEKDKNGDRNITMNKIVVPRIQKIMNGAGNAAVVKGMHQGTALVTDHLSKMISVQAEIGNAQIGLLTSLNNQLAGIGEMMNTMGRSFYEASNDYYQMQASAQSTSSEVASLMLDKLKSEKEEKDKKLARQFSMGKNYNSMFDMSDPAKGIGGISDLLFGEVGMLKETFARIGTDPLGFIMASLVASQAKKHLGGAINGIKNYTKSLGYRSQGLFEKWSDNQFNGGAGNFLKGMLGSSLKQDRSNMSSAKLGSYIEEETAFDTTTRKAIVDVIPMYLSKILKAISGSSGHEVYDYKSGRFVNSKDKAKEARKEMNAIKRGEFMGGINGDLLDMRLSGMSEGDFNQIRESMIRAAMDGDSFKTNIKDIKMRNPRLQKQYDDYISKMSKSDFTDLTTSFQGHKYEQANAVNELNKRLSSGSLGQSATLEDIGTYIRGETNRSFMSDKERKKRAKDAGLDIDLRNNPGDILDIFGGSRNADGGRSIFDFRNRIGADGKPLTGGLSSAFDMIKSGVIKNASDFKNFLGKGAGKLGGDLSAAFDMVRSGDITSIKDFRDVISSGKSGADARAGLNGSRGLGSRIANSVYSVLGVLGLKRETIDEFRKNAAGALKGLFNVGKGIVSADGTRLSKDQLKDMSFKELMFSKFDQAINKPLKLLFGKGKGIVGGDGKMLSPEQLQSMTFKDLISSKLDQSIAQPLKTLFSKGKGLKDVDGNTISADAMKSMNFRELIGLKFDQGVIKPMKRLFEKGNGVVGADGKKITGDQLETMGFKDIVTMKLDQSVLTPMKDFMLGKFSTSKGGTMNAKETPFLEIVKLSMNEYVGKPIKRILFGSGNEEKSFMKNLGDVTAPFFNKLFFGKDATSKGLAENFKAFGSRMWGSISEKFIQPAKDAMKELFGPVFKDFKDTFKESFKDFLGSFNIEIGKGFKAGAKGFLTTVFGDDTVAMLKTNIVDPINNAAKTIRDSLSNVFKFMLRLPANFLSGITNTMKLSRLKSGKGNYSDEEKERLLSLESTGRLFNFGNLGNGKSIDFSREGIKNSLRNFGNGLRGKRDSAIAGAKGMYHGATDVIKDRFGNTISNIQDKAGDIKDSLSSHAENIKGRFNSFSRTGGGLGISTPLNGLELNKNVKAISTNTKLHIMPAIKKSESNTDKILRFLKENLTNVSNTTHEIVRLLRDKSYSTDGKSSSKSSGKGGIKGFLGRIFGRAGSTIEKIISLPLSIIGSFTTAVAKTIDAIKSFPARIIKGIGEGVGKVFNGLKKLIEPLFTFVGKIIKGVGTAIEKSVELIGTAANKLFKWTSSILEFAVKIPGKLIGLLKPVGSVVKDLSKATWGVIKTFGSLALSATKLVAKFTWATAKFAGRTAKKVGGKLLGVFGLGGSNGTGSSSDQAYANAKALIKMSKTSPLYVYVKDGKIGTYEYKGRRGTIFNSHMRKNSLLGLKKEKKEMSLLEKLAPLLLGFKGIIGKIAKMLGMKKAAESLAGGRGGSTILGGEGGNGRNRGRDNGGRGGRFGRLGRTVGKFGKNLVKGGWKGFGISAIGNLGADLLFDEGSTGHNMVSKAADYGGWGAMIGSVIPGVGTAIGAVIGAAVGGLMGLFPQIEEYIGKGWDWIKEKTGKFISWAWDGIKGAGKWLWDGITGIWKGITGAFSWVTGKVSAAWNWYTDKLSKTWNFVTGIVSKSWEGIKKGFSWVGDKVSEGWNWLTGTASKAWDSVTNTVSAGWESIKDGASWVGDKVSKGWTWYTGKLAEGWDWYKKQASNLWEGAKNIASNAGDYIQDKWKTVKGGIGSAFSWVKSKFSASEEELSATADDSLTAVTGSVSKMFGFLKDGIGNIAKSVTSGFMNMTGNIGSGMKQMVSKGITGFRAMLGKLSIDVPFFGKLTLPGGITEEEAAKQMSNIDADAKKELSENEKAAKKLTNPSDTKGTWNPNGGSSKILDGIKANLAATMYTATVTNATQKALAEGKGKIDNTIVKNSQAYPDTTPAIALQTNPGDAITNSLSAVSEAAKMGTTVSGGDITPPLAPSEPYTGQFGAAQVALSEPAGISYSQIPNTDGSVDSTLRMLAAVGIATGVDPRVLAAISGSESGFKASAKNPGKGQSAAGLFQFIDDTWAGMLRKYGPKYGLPMNTSKFDPRANSLMGALYIRENMEGLQKTLNRPLVTTDAYMAHFLGLGGARNFFRQSPDAPASTFLTPDGLSANKTIAYDSNGRMRTASGVYQVLSKKMDKGGQYVDKVMGFANQFGKHGFPTVLPGAGSMPLLNGQEGVGAYDPNSMINGGAGPNGPTAISSGFTLPNGMDAVDLIKKMGGESKIGDLVNNDAYNMFKAPTASVASNDPESGNIAVSDQTKQVVGYENANKTDTAKLNAQENNKIKETVNVDVDNTEVVGKQSETNQILEEIRVLLEGNRGLFSQGTNVTNVNGPGTNASNRSLNSPNALRPSNSAVTLAKGGADL